MLATVKDYIKKCPDKDFDTFYQDYICDVQDQNIITEINSVKSDDMEFLRKMIAKLNNQYNNGYK